jgi:hypothetical protein
VAPGAAVHGRGRTGIASLRDEAQDKEIHTLKDAVTWTAILAGYQNRKHDPRPVLT